MDRRRFLKILTVAGVATVVSLGTVQIFAHGGGGHGGHSGGHSGGGGHDGHSGGHHSEQAHVHHSDFVGTQGGGSQDPGPQESHYHHDHDDYDDHHHDCRSSESIDVTREPNRQECQLHDGSWEIH
jgi:hypothetical protein